MFMHLQQLATRIEMAGPEAGLNDRVVSLKANTALLLDLSLIPTLSGVALIA